MVVADDFLALIVEGDLAEDPVELRKVSDDSARQGRNVARRRQVPRRRQTGRIHKGRPRHAEPARGTGHPGRELPLGAGDMFGERNGDVVG